ncbi:Rieske 2Fe-2S domain-containing protein [Zhongshania aquimaris]|uniref:Rieske 2Fe-2S domain-containing protein n=1 Tax=Zhongshania aquimaris TaxID=2857107 RepID=A0ABS6VV31_9GAMM|nr:Rieske 2Fe-2S domain-containing protein [Zhongshania aquimaris]MBW2942183.1 Rieske 2Fe-2S domain-containing protein [Zhongshania aquimaris]
MKPSPMSLRAPSREFPKGWYCVADSKEVKVEKLLPVSWLGRDYVVFRDTQGLAKVADAYCPHLGAHLASHDGCIKEGRVICPFHHWGFDTSTGKCTDIPYAKVIPPVSLTFYEVREVNEQIVIWYHPEGLAPDREPYQSDLLKEREWVLFDSRSWTSSAPFCDILENLFDTAHILMLHHAHETPKLGNIEELDYGLKVDYIMDPDKSDQPMKSLTCHISGITLLVQHYEFVGTEALFVFSFTPIDHEYFVQRTHLYLLNNVSPEVMENIGKEFVDRFVMEVDQDMEVLNFKKHLTKPRLCDGDGPILRFRRYSNQFLEKEGV